MEDAKQQLAEKLLAANNILVTVSRNPSVDQLAALLGLTLILNKQGKHTAAVFSGEVPSTLEFLQPEETIEKNTDSLRDFIIALDKNKADKLRYKVEDNVVKIFITPYKTSISQDDFDFSQGDFNVDLVVALGVQQQEDLDDAITAHGRILHDATVASITIGEGGNVGTINWNDPAASSLSELVTELIDEVALDKLDEQIATALLTGIVSETDRFRNEKTSSRTMTMSATLMSAGANQQLVASKLEEPAEPVSDEASDSLHADETTDAVQADNHDGTIEIDHTDADNGAPPELPSFELPTPAEDTPQESGPSEPADIPEPTENISSGGSQLVTEPPVMGGTLTANSTQPGLDPVTDPFSMPQAEDAQMFDRKPDPVAPLTPPPTDWTPPPSDQPQSASPVDQPAPAEQLETPETSDQATPTLSDLEASVHHADAADEPVGDLNAARDEVSRAINGGIDTAAPPTEPVAALNAQPFGGNLHEPAPPLEEQIPGLSPTLEFHKQQEQADESQVSDQPPIDAQDPQVIDPNAPPPVPPPIPFQFGNPPKQQ